jgi:hypothetical protein
MSGQLRVRNRAGEHHPVGVTEATGLLLEFGAVGAIADYEQLNLGHRRDHSIQGGNELVLSFALHHP